MREVYNSMHRLIDEDTQAQSVYWIPPNGDFADALFREGTRHLPASVLTSYDYDMSSFKEEQLPDAVTQPPPPSNQLAGTQEQFKHSHRSYWIVIQDIEATRKFFDNKDYKYHGVQNGTAAIQSLIDTYKLQQRKAGVLCPATGESIRKSFMTSWAKQARWSHHMSRNSGDVTMWNAGREDWDPKYISILKGACDELTRRDSLLSYDPSSANPFLTETKGQSGEGDAASGTAGEAITTGGRDGILAHRKTARAAHGEPDYSALPSITANPVVSVRSSASRQSPRLQASTREEYLEVSSSTSLATTNRANVIVDLKHTPIPSQQNHYQWTASPPEGSRIRLPPGTHGAPHIGQKRKPGLLRHPTAARRRHKPDPKTLKSEHFQSGSSSRATRSESTAEEVSGTSTLTSTASQPTPPGPGFATTNGSQSARTSYSGPLFPYEDHRTASNAPIPLNISQLEREISAIQTHTVEATTQLLEHIGDVRQSQMPLCPEAPSSAVVLLVRCWGSQWSETQLELVQSKLFVVPEVVMSLCSAYLLELFNREWPVCIDVDCKLLESHGRGRAMLSQLRDGEYSCR